MRRRTRKNQYHTSSLQINVINVLAYLVHCPPHPSVVTINTSIIVPSPTPLFVATIGSTRSVAVVRSPSKHLPRHPFPLPNPHLHSHKPYIGAVSEQIAPLPDTHIPAPLLTWTARTPQCPAIPRDCDCGQPFQSFLIIAKQKVLCKRLKIQHSPWPERIVTKQYH